MAGSIALYSGKPGRKTFLHFHRPWFGEEEVNEVTKTLESGWITTGPRTKQFEKDFISYIGCREAIALNSCTAGLHLALYVLGIGEGDEVVTSPVTFPATANVILHLGAKPVFVDVRPDNLNINESLIERVISSRTKAILPVHFAGHPANMDEIMDVSKRYAIPIVEDAAHCLEGYYRGRKIGTIGDFTSFSFYATKNITTGEGGMLTMEDSDLATRIRILSLHGISKDAWKRYTVAGCQHWELIEPGYKYNMFDLQAAIGIHQLKKINFFLERRKYIYKMYEAAFQGSKFITLLNQSSDVSCAYHLFVVKLNIDALSVPRDTIIAAMEAENIGVGLHFRSLHLQPFFINNFGFSRGMYPVAEEATDKILSLPLYPKMSDEDVYYVIETFQKVLSYFER